MKVMSCTSKERYFEKILQDIKTVKIQGAENVAKAGIEAFCCYL
jgi:hypothetical protein